MKYPHIESKNLEFKEFLDDYRRVAESVVAFANGQGGEVIVGIRDIDREILGLSDSHIQKYNAEIPQALADMISPQLAVDTFERNIDGQVCFIIKVFPGPHKPYFISRQGYPEGIYLRYGSHNRPADEYAIRDLERHRNNQYFENVLNTACDFSALSSHGLNRVLHSTNAQTFISCGYGAQDADQHIKPFNSAVLLFHSRPSLVIPEAYLTVTQFSGPDTAAIMKRETFDGSIIEQYEGAFEYLQSATGGDYFLSGTRMVPAAHEYPVEALREVLVNAIVHRAYDYEAPVRISLFSDRMEILNPGTFFAPINAFTLRDGLSRYRNPSVAHAFRKLNFMEKQGVGINRIIDSCHAAGLAQPSFRELEHFVKVVIYKKVAPEQKVMEQPSFTYALAGKEHSYLRFFHDRETITSREFAQFIGKSQPMAKKILFSLCQKGLITKVGKARATYYVLKR